MGANLLKILQIDIENAFFLLTAFLITLARLYTKSKLLAR